MINKSLKYLTILLSLTGIVNKTYSEVRAPNYDFSLDQFKIFMPDSNQSTIEEKYGKGKTLFENEEFRSLRWHIKHERYNFPVVAQVYRKKVLDFHTNLPSYFLHNVFHQSLINRFGKQNTYRKKDGHAIYVWNLKDFKIYYMATCTITCFPIYLSVVKSKLPDELYSYQPLLVRMIDN